MLAEALENALLHLGRIRPCCCGRFRATRLWNSVDRRQRATECPFIEGAAEAFSPSNERALIRLRRLNRSCQFHAAAGDRLKSQARFPNPIRAATSKQGHSVVLPLTSEPAIDWQFDLTQEEPRSSNGCRMCALGAIGGPPSDDLRPDRSSPRRQRNAQLHLQIRSDCRQHRVENITRTFGDRARRSGNIAVTMAEDRREIET